DFPYISRCGLERNYLRCDDRPIVFTDFQNDGKALRIGQSARTYPFEPTSLSMLSNGRLYHNSPFCDYALIMSKTADRLFPLFTFDEHGYPIVFRWKGEVYTLNNEIRKMNKYVILAEEISRMSAPGAPKKHRHSNDYGASTSTQKLSNNELFVTV
ncbi:unnamed protein product, partial [Strongylus vulgaris]